MTFGATPLAAGSELARSVDKIVGRLFAVLTRNGFAKVRAGQGELSGALELGGGIGGDAAGSGVHEVLHHGIPRAVGAFRLGASCAVMFVVRLAAVIAQAAGVTRRVGLGSQESDASSGDVGRRHAENDAFHDLAGDNSEANFVGERVPVDLNAVAVRKGRRLEGDVAISADAKQALRWRGDDSTSGDCRGFHVEANARDGVAVRSSRLEEGPGRIEGSQTDFSLIQAIFAGRGATARRAARTSRRLPRAAIFIDKERPGSLGRGQAGEEAKREQSSESHRCRDSRDRQAKQHGF